MSNYQKPEVEIVKFTTLEAITSEDLGGGNGDMGTGSFSGTFNEG